MCGRAQRRTNLTKREEISCERLAQQTPPLFWVKKYKMPKKPSIKQRKKELQKAGNRDKKGPQKNCKVAKNKMYQ